MERKVKKMQECHGEAISVSGRKGSGTKGNEGERNERRGKGRERTEGNDEEREARKAMAGERRNQIRRRKEDEG